MKLFGVGNALLHYREKNEISQIQLCEGICSLATLSRIETGEREYDSLISETLLSRLGKTAYHYEFVLNEEDYHLYTIRENIEKSINEEKIKEAEKLIKEYEKFMPQNQVLHEQCLLFYKAMVLKLEGGEEKEIIQILKNAMNLTKKDYIEKSDAIKLFSSMEIKIFYELFLYELYDESKLDSLFLFIMRFYDREEKERTLIPFLYKLIYKYEKEEKYENVIKVSEAAIEIICNGKSYCYLADFYFQKLKSEEKLYGTSEKWRNNKEELAELCNNLFYLYMIEENQEQMDQVEAFCQEKLQCRIIKPEIL